MRMLLTFEIRVIKAEEVKPDIWGAFKEATTLEKICMVFLLIAIVSLIVLIASLVVSGIYSVYRWTLLVKTEEYEVEAIIRSTAIEASTSDSYLLIGDATVPISNTYNTYLTKFEFSDNIYCFSSKKVYDLCQKHVNSIASVMIRTRYYKDDVVIRDIVAFKKIIVYMNDDKR